MSNLVSIHGGHSGDFCNHAKDTLEEIIRRYIEMGFKWVGITEHGPPPHDKFLYDDEIDAGQTAESLQKRFSVYFKTARELQEEYKDDITILVGFEGEAYTGSIEFTDQLLTEYKPDYFIGSVHHVRDTCIDSSAECMNTLAERIGGMVTLYCEYFDLQYEMLEALLPPVIGHVDLIRLYDPEYQTHLIHPVVWEKIERNLQFIAKNNLILDFNVCPLRKGATEPYVSAPILKRAHELGITLIPGDDSHGIDQVGANIEDAIRILEEYGFNVSFPIPAFK